MGRVIVTGGAGFVGANLVRMLLQEGWRVTVLDDLSSGRARYLDDLRIDFVGGDVCAAETVRKLVRGHDAVIHLAAQTGVPAALDDPLRDCRINVQGTVNMLEAARAAEVARFVLASSNAVIGAQAPPAAEDLAPLPLSPYGASKLAAEGYCLAYHGSWRMKTIALRFGNVYGPFSAHKNSVVAKLFKDALASRHLIIDGDGRQTRDFIDVGDVCRAVVAALQSDLGGEIFQIASGVETSILKLSELIRAVVDKEIDIEHAPARQGDAQRNYSVIGKAQRMLGWRPSISLRAGLEQTWNWFNGTTPALASDTAGRNV